MNTHGLERTSPMGDKFLWKCRYCDKEGLPIGAALAPCEKAPLQDQQVLDAITDQAMSEGQV